ncbi:caspase domain-containing protein [Dichotomocladium elegans]|nr:caspase domain-containing protein [Dichotomocladium elegans]
MTTNRRVFRSSALTALHINLRADMSTAPVTTQQSVVAAQPQAQTMQVVVNLQLSNPGEGQQLNMNDIQAQIAQQLAALTLTANPAAAPAPAASETALATPVIADPATIAATTTNEEPATAEASGTEPSASEDVQNDEEEEEEQEPERPIGDGPRKRAVIIGINYIGQSDELAGCIGDALSIKKLLTTTYGYTEENIRFMTDDQKDTPSRIPTTLNIMRSIRWLVNQAKAGDKLFFYYSGHGTQVEDSDGDEVDFQDEAICPLDCDEHGVITDDWLNYNLVRGVPEGCRLTAVFDSCFSGSVLDLPYMYRTNGRVMKESLLKTATKDILAAGLHFMNGDKTEMYDTFSLLSKKVLKTRHIEKTNKYTKGSKADIIMFSGCRDNQYSADAREENQRTGALTYAFTKILNTKPNPTYRELLTDIRNTLKIRYDQIPQLSSSHEMNLDCTFAC